MKSMDPTPLRPDAPIAPTLSMDPYGSQYTSDHGLTARQHAAIALCVPDSGTEWLDDMIRQKLERQELVTLAAAGFSRGAYGAQTCVAVAAEIAANIDSLFQESKGGAA